VDEEEADILLVAAPLEYRKDKKVASWSGAIWVLYASVYSYNAV